MELLIDPNKLSRNQAIGPSVLLGGERSGAGTKILTSDILTLRQLDSFVVPVQYERG